MFCVKCQLDRQQMVLFQPMKTAVSSLDQLASVGCFSVITECLYAPSATVHLDRVCKNTPTHGQAVTDGVT